MSKKKEDTINRRIKKQRYSNIVDKVLEGETMKNSLINAGFSESLAKSSTNLVRSRTFKELLDEKLPEDYVLDEHRKLYGEHRNLKQVRLDTLDDKVINKALEGYENAQAIKNEEEGYTMLVINEVDKEARKNAIDMAYKLRGSFSPLKIEVKRTYEDLTDKQILEMMKGS